MQSDSQLKHFLYKLFTKYFFYGYLTLFLMIVSVFFFYFFLHEEKYLKLLSLVPLCSFIWGASRFFPICFSTKKKFQYYRISIYRLKTRPFNEEWFKYEMYEPCMRLIIRDLCYEFGYKKEYAKLKKDYASKYNSIKAEKERVLKEFINKKNKEYQNDYLQSGRS